MSYFNHVCLPCLATGVKVWITPGSETTRPLHDPDGASEAARAEVRELDADHQAVPVEFRDERVQLALLASAVMMIAERAPQAEVIELQTSDQGRYGFVLHGLRDERGTELLPSWSEPGHPLATLESDAWDLLADLNWDGVVKEDGGGYAEINIREFLGGFRRAVTALEPGLSQLADRLPAMP